MVCQAHLQALVTTCIEISLKIIVLKTYCTFFRIYFDYKSDGDEWEDDTVTILPAGAVLPDGLTLVELRSQSYYLETTVPCTLQAYNKKLKELSPLLVEMRAVDYVRHTEAEPEILLENERKYTARMKSLQSQQLSQQTIIQ